MEDLNITKRTLICILKIYKGIKQGKFRINLSETDPLKAVSSEGVGPFVEHGN